MKSSATHASSDVNAKYSKSHVSAHDITVDAEKLQPCAITTKVIMESAIGDISDADLLNRTAIEAAWNTLWAPMSEFPLASASDRGAVAAAILTAAIRNSLPTSPGFAIVGNGHGRGKTLLATSIAELAGGSIAMPLVGVGAGKLRQRLRTVLHDGCSAVLLDDLSKEVKSSAIEEMIAMEHLNDKILFTDQYVQVSTRVMVLLSGNFTVGGDLWRRLVTIQFAAPGMHTERRTGRQTPRTYCRTHRAELTTAARTILKGFVAVGLPRFTPDRLASFEAWDDIIRQCVLWLNHAGIADFGDPLGNTAAPNS